LKAAKRTATNAPVVSCWVLAIATLDDVADAAEADADLAEEPVAEEDAVEVAKELAAAEEELELLESAAEAFSVPHFSSLVQVAWPSASLGWAVIHWLNVAWQMKKGRVCS